MSERAFHFNMEGFILGKTGYFKFSNTSNQDREKAAVAWEDNEDGIMALNCFYSNPIHKAKQGKRRKTFFRHTFCYS